MKQMTLSAVGFDRHTKQTRRAAFLADMNRVVPWKQLCALIEPFYPKAGNGRPPVGLERMLRIYFLQNWFNLSAPRGKKSSRKSSVRAKVEHAFLIIKRIFGFAKVCYRGMAKNGNCLFVVAALANLFMARHRLLRLPQERCV